MNVPDVDVIVPVHSASRPIHRAVASVLTGTEAKVRAIVVAHNIEADIIRTNLAEFATDSRVEILHISDGIPSPSGPMNYGIAHARAPYFSLLGSDDELAPGAIDAWLTLAQDTGATTVLARIDRELSGSEPYPPTRLGRTRELDAVKDRLAYRCAPLGLISREHFSDIRFTPTLRSGEDLEFTARLWFTGSHIAYARSGPGYVGHEDATDRVTNATRTVEEDFAFLESIESAPWFSSLSKAQRRALGVKNLRLHFFDAVFARLQSPEGIAAHRDALDRVITQIERMSPGALRLLARVDRSVIDAVRAPGPDPAAILELLAARWGGSLDARLPRNPLLALHPQAPYRTNRAMIA